MKFEDYLAPWEINEKGEKLDEPAEIDPEKLKRHLYNVQEDKDKAQTERDDVKAELANAQETITTMQREKESDAERHAREEKEREQRYAKLEAEKVERDKIKAISKHFKDQGIEADRAERLASRVTGENETEWVQSATELVEDGFRLTDKVVETTESGKEETDNLTSIPRVVRSDGKPPKTAKENTGKSFSEELDELIPVSTW